MQISLAIWQKIVIFKNPMIGAETWNMFVNTSKGNCFLYFSNNVAKHVHAGWISRNIEINETTTHHPTPPHPTPLIIPITYNFLAFSHSAFWYLFVMFMENFIVRKTMNCKLWYSCWGHLMKFSYFSDGVNVLKWRGVFCLLGITIFLLLLMLFTSIYIKYKKIFESVLIGDTESTS